MLNQILPAAGELHLLTLNQIYLLWVSSGKRHQRTGPTALFILCLFIFLAASNLDIIQHSSIHPTTHLFTCVQLVPLTAPGGLKVQACAATTASITLFSCDQKPVHQSICLSVHPHTSKYSRTHDSYL